MKGKLVKEVDFYGLKFDNKIIGTSNEEINNLLNYPFKLSLKNCEAIERGYDLDELAKNYLLNKWLPNTNQEDRDLWYLTTDWSKEVVNIIKNFYIELMGDKKFSEDDVIKIAEYIRVDSQSSPSVKTKDLLTEYQSLQQTEWNVEVEMEFIEEEKTGTDLFWGRNIPKLDADGCLIIKHLK
jgi:hypothetical protein